jgi:hypothetical protein
MDRSKRSFHLSIHLSPIQHPAVFSHFAFRISQCGQLETISTSMSWSSVVRVIVRFSLISP